jgi:hypothetical protein
MTCLFYKVNGQVLIEGIGDVLFFLNGDASILIEVTQILCCIFLMPGGCTNRK